MAKIVFKWEILMPSGKVFDAGHLTNKKVAPFAWRGEHDPS